MWRRVAKGVAVGAARGLAYYAVFLVLVPRLFGDALGVSIEPPTGLALLTLGVFVGLGIASSSAKPFVSVTLDALTSLLAVYVLVRVWGTEVSTDVGYSGAPVEAYLGYAPLPLLVSCLILLYAVVSCFERLTKLEE